MVVLLFLANNVVKEHRGSERTRHILRTKSALLADVLDLACVSRAESHDRVIRNDDDTNCTSW